MRQSELQIIMCALNAWEREARSDEPHFVYSDEYKKFRSKIKKLIKKK